MDTVMITGANRGIGLGFAQQYARLGWRVLACCRHPEAAEELRDIEGEVSIHQLDVTDFAHIEELGRALNGEAIDILINNAGVYGPRDATFNNVDYNAWRQVLEVNTLAPLKLSEVFLPHVLAGNRKIIACITSKMGSIADNSSGGSYIYRSSKAALNAVVKSMSVDLTPREIICVVLHPGWVRTDMGGPGGLIDTETSVLGMRNVLDNLHLDQSGFFFNFDGSMIPW